MPRNYGDGDDNDCYDGTGGASGRYGSATPLLPLHRRGVFETDERARIQHEAEGGDDTAPAPFFPFPSEGCD